MRRKRCSDRLVDGDVLRLAAHRTMPFLGRPEYRLTAVQNGPSHSRAVNRSMFMICCRRRTEFPEILQAAVASKVIALNLPYR